MAAGDLTASTPVLCASMSAIKNAIDALNLAATTDTIHIIRTVEQGSGLYYVFKVERAAA